MGWPFWLQVVPVVVLLVLGVSVGAIVERAHFRRLAVREEALRDMYVTDLRLVPAERECRLCSLVVGEVVIASDYFKTFAATLRKIVGGELRAFDTLMQRAQREARLRMMESASRMGANGVVNVRYVSSNIGMLRRRRKAAMVEMMAYGTAVCFPDGPRS